MGNSHHSAHTGKPHTLCVCVAHGVVLACMYVLQCLHMWRPEVGLEYCTQLLSRPGLSLSLSGLLLIGLDCLPLPMAPGLQMYATTPGLELRSSCLHSRLAAPKPSLPFINMLLGVVFEGRKLSYIFSRHCIMNTSYRLL